MLKVTIQNHPYPQYFVAEMFEKDVGFINIYCKDEQTKYFKSCGSLFKFNQYSTKTISRLFKGQVIELIVSVEWYIEKVTVRFILRKPNVQKNINKVHSLLFEGLLTLDFQTQQQKVPLYSLRVQNMYIGNQIQNLDQQRSNNVSKQQYMLCRKLVKDWIQQHLRDCVSKSHSNKQLLLLSSMDKTHLQMIDWINKNEDFIPKQDIGKQMINEKEQKCENLLIE